MRVEQHLDKDDITAIIARHFNVPKDKVFVDCYMDTYGYGMSESQEPCVRAVITVQEGELE